MSQDNSTPSALERVVAYAAVTIIIASVASFFATLIAALVGVSRESLAVGFWPVVTWVGYVGVPLGFALVIVVVVLAKNRRVRALGEEKNR